MVDPLMDEFAVEFDARRVEDFFNDETIKRVWRETEESIVNEWKKAQSECIRELCWNRIQALRALEARMRAVADAAVRVHPEREVRPLPF